MFSFWYAESVSSIEGCRNRRRRKKKKPKYHGEISNTSDDTYRGSSGYLSELTTQASSERSHNNSNTSEPCTNGEDSKIIKNGSPHSSKQSRDTHIIRSLSNSVPNTAELSVSKETSVVNGLP